MIGHDEPLTADYHEGLLNNNVNARRWKAATVAAGALTVVGAVATYSLMNERAVLQAQLIAQQQRTTQASATPRAPSATRPATILKAGSIATGPVIQTIGTLCTAAGTDMYSSGAPLPCCDGLVQVNAPLGDQIGQFCVSPDMPGDACTVAGLDVHDNSLEAALKCCPGLVEVPTTCRGTDTCMYCQPASMALPEGCTPAGKDVFSNPTGEAQPCCPGLTSSMAPCRGDDMCEFCIPLTYTDGPKAEYGPAKISVDPLTPEAALNKYNEDGMSMIFSDEFKDLGRTKSMFVFEDIPYGVPGNTGDVNIASIYASDTVSLLPEGGMRLSCFMAPEDEKLFMQGWNGTWNSNYGSDVSLWSWHAPKVTSRLNARFQYGLIETRIKAPKGYGPWPAAWLNGCYGFIAEASGEFLLQDDYPFLCGQYWPPELDFFEHFSPEHTWFWRPNSMSLHSPNQYVGTGKTLTAQGGYCPTTLSPPGGAWCFGVSGAGSFRDDPTERFINYAMKWDPDGVDYYMDDVFMHRFTTDQLVMYLSGQLRPVMIPEMPMFLTFNIALVRKGMDLSHGGEGLTDRSNFDPDTGKWKDMAMDIEYVRVYQDDTQGETRGLNPPITYQTRRKLLANKVTCDLVPELVRPQSPSPGPPPFPPNSSPPRLLVPPPPRPLFTLRC